MVPSLGRRGMSGVEWRGDRPYRGICMHECVVLGKVCVCELYFPHSASIRETLERNTFSTSFFILSSQLSSVYTMHVHRQPHSHPCMILTVHPTYRLLCKACKWYNKGYMFNSHCEYPDQNCVHWKYSDKRSCFPLTENILSEGKQTLPVQYIQ